MHSRPHWLRLLLVALFALFTVACGPQLVDDGAQGGMGVPVQLAGETYPGARDLLQAELDVTETGCLHVVVDGESRFAIWPAGAELADALRLPDGTVLADGDRIEALGAATPAAPLTANRDGYWANAIGFCDPQADVVMVLDDVRRLD